MEKGEPDIRDRNEEVAFEERLDSWKEIATYLRHSERTVRRWEEEGLPVHRRLHKKKAAIYGYKAEIDAWWRDGHHRVEQQEQTGVAARRRGLLGLVAASLLVAAVGAGYYAKQVFRPRQAGPSKPVMLAVLPFENLSGDQEQEYFSDGLTEEMISQLARLNPQRLAVIARTSTMQYKRASRGIGQIGRELGVDYILEGTVRRAGARLRVSAQLIRVSNQAHVLAASYERDLRDALVLQSELARAVAHEIQVTLKPQEQPRLANVRQVNPQAHELYLWGRYCLRDRTEEGLKKGVQYFEQAIEKDPTYAPAHAGLAESYTQLWDFGILRAREVNIKALGEARRALEIDDDLAEAHAVLGLSSMDFDWDWVGAEREFKRSLELDPGYVSAHHWYALWLLAQGRVEDAVAEIKRAQELDPLSTVINTLVGQLYYFARRYDQAIEQCHKTIELASGTPNTHRVLGEAYEQKGMFAEAIAEFQMAIRQERNPVFIAALGHTYAVAGRRAEARSVLDELKEFSKRRYVPLFEMAVIYAGLGEKDTAFATLRTACQEHSGRLYRLNTDPRLDPLRPDPRFKDLLHCIGLLP